MPSIAALLELMYNLRSFFNIYKEEIFIMDINKIQYFFMAAELGNLTQAAERSGIAQTTMSKYINTLETEVGCRLFARTNKGCSLTGQGEKFYIGMRKVYEQYSDLRKQMDRIDERVLWIGIEGDHHNIPEFLMFEQEHPETSIAVLFGSRKRLLKNLKEHKYDAALLIDISTEDVVRELHLGTTLLPGKKELLICSKNAMDKYGSIEAVIQELPMVTKTDDVGYHEFCRESLRRRFGVTFDGVSINESISKQQLIVSLSQGFAIVPKFEIAYEDEFCMIPMNEKFSTSLQLVYCKDNISEDLRALITFIERTFSDAE